MLVLSQAGGTGSAHKSCSDYTDGPADDSDSTGDKHTAHWGSSTIRYADGYRTAYNR